jgi:opacity protein-like surface antigen
MGKRLNLLTGCAFTAMLAAGQAIGADLPPPPAAPPPPPEVHYGSCVYGRADVGYAMNNRPRVFKNGGGGYNEAIGEEFDDNFVADVGVGCNVTDYLRADLTFGYRSSTDVKDDFNSLSAEVSSYTAMVNGYFDIGTFAGVTPYVGAGVGVAYNRLRNVSLPAGQQGGSDVRFAWALHAGASFQLTDSMAIDASYRYIDLGKVKGDSAVDPINVENLSAHDVRIGLRINFDD